MADTTGIEWADRTWSPWVGCTKVSAACDHCYAEAWAKRTGSPALWQGERRRTSADYWRKPLKWDRQASDSGERPRIFPSLCDPFDNQAHPDWRADFWALIAKTPHLDWLLLTKRPQNIAKMLPGAYVEQLIGRDLPSWPWPNVWLGMTAENQEEFDRRYPYLAAIPAAVHFVSYEPALGPLSLRDAYPLPDWFICGGESGPGARQMSADWARALRDECSSIWTRFFMKQMTRKAPIPADLLVREFPT